MQRRNARLRREYLYKRSLEGKEKEEHERKAQMRSALASGAPLPGNLAVEAEALKSAIELEDDRTQQLRVRCCYFLARAASGSAMYAHPLPAPPPTPLSASRTSTTSTPRRASATRACA